MTTPDQNPTTAHDPTEKPLLEELPYVLTRIEQQLAALTLPPHARPPTDPGSTIGEARVELNRTIALIRQAAPAELEVQWLRVPTADAKTILYTVDRALAGDPTGSTLLRWPAYDALRHLLWRDDKLFTLVLRRLQALGNHDVALRLRNGCPDTTALQGLSFAPDKEFIAAARVSEAGEVAKMDNPGAAADAVLTAPSTTQGNGGRVSFTPSTDTVALADAAWRAEGEEIRDRAAADYANADALDAATDAVLRTGGDATPGSTRPPEDYVLGKVTLSDAIRSQEARDPEGAAALREAGGDALKAVELLRTRAASPVSQSDALRRAMTEIDRGLDGYKLSPEVELARIQVDVLLLLVETLRGDFESRLANAMVGALEDVAAERERGYTEKWKGTMFMAGQEPPKPESIADLRAVAIAIKERLGIGG